jgi:hypothetical protein
MYEIYGFHSGEDLGRGFLDCGTLQFGRWYLFHTVYLMTLSVAQSI